MKRILAIALMLGCLCSFAIAEEGTWNYVLRPDGTARLTRAVVPGAAIPRTVDGFAVTQAPGDAGSLPAGVSPVPALPEADGTTEEGLVYALVDGRATILGYTGEAERLILPRSIQGRAVTSIAEGAFRDNWTISHVLLPDTLIEIGDSVFQNCKRLTQIHFDRGVLTIGEYAFSGCDALTRVILPKDLTCVGAYAFAYTPLTRASLPDAVLVVGESAFDHIPELGYIRLGSSIRVIERYAFAEAPLRRVKLPESVQRVGRGAFARTAYLSAEDAELKAALPELGLTEADLTTRNWPEPEEDEPIITLTDIDVPLGGATPAPTATPTAEVTAQPDITPDATPQPAETPEPTPEATATPTPEPAAEPTAEPTTEPHVVEAQESAPAISGQQVRITASLAKLRSQPATSAYMIQYAYPGDTFPFERKHRGGWYGLYLPDGTVAYVARGMAEIIGE